MTDSNGVRSTLGGPSREERAGRRVLTVSTAPEPLV